MKKIILGLISFTMVLGCSGGSEPGPVDPTANNAEAQKAKTEAALSKVPPEFRDRAAAAAGGGQNQRYPGPGKK